MTKQPCSWWVASGETLPLKPHDKVALGGEQARGPYDQESCASVVTYPTKVGQSGSRALLRRAKAMEGVKILAEQRRGTRRRSGIGTCAQFSTERARAVSAPALRPWASLPGVLREAAKPITGSTGKWWNAERQSAEVIVAMIGVDNITRRSEGPLARSATEQRPRHLPRSLAGRLGQSPTPLARWNVAGRLPGGTACEGEPHARCGRGSLETGQGTTLKTAPAAYLITGAAWGVVVKKVL